MRCILEVCLLSGNYVLLPHIKLIYVDPELPYHLHRFQVPVTSAFAMTINKAQGQSFGTVGVDLCNPCFLHGHLYVALLQARLASAIKCIVDKLARNGDTTNIVFKEVVL